MDPNMFMWLMRRMMQPPQPVNVKIDLSAIRDLFDQKKIRSLDPEPQVDPLPVAVVNQLPMQRPG